MQKTITAVLLCLACLLLGGVWTTAEEFGAEQMHLYGGDRGAVPFPHRRHQERLTDCNICHAVFPRQKDSIKTMQAAGALSPKVVMNKQCIKCHRAEKRAGNPSGPTTCSKCHVRGG